MIKFIKTHKTIFLTLAVVLFGIVIWGIVLLYQKNAGRAPQQPVITAVQQPTIISTWQIYRNEELGFEIQIPQRWVNEYKIEEKKTIGPGFGSVSFSKRVQWINKAGDLSFSEHMVLGITVATPGWWEMISNSPADRPTVIMATDQKVYVYRKDQDSSRSGVDEISKVLSTFKLIP